MVEAGLITAIGIIWILCRFNLKRVAGHAALWDIIITGGLTALFIGTYAGMVTGMFAGVIVSLFLTGVRKIFGYERYEACRLPGEKVGKFRWVSYGPAKRRTYKAPKI